jgi:hypothetical protein
MMPRTATRLIKAWFWKLKKGCCGGVVAAGGKAFAAAPAGRTVGFTLVTVEAASALAVTGVGAGREGKGAEDCSEALILNKSPAYRFGNHKLHFTIIKYHWDSQA